MTDPVYVLQADSNKDVTLGSDLEYFRTHFVAEPMTVWIPPSVRIIGKSKRLRDFVSWMNAVPVISPTAADALRPLIGAHCELLPLVELRGKLYSAVNVLTTVDCLDHARSEILYATDEPDHILSISSYHLHLDRVPAEVPIFKLPEYTGCVFVTGLFVEMIRSSKLRGAAFLDPAINPLSKIMRREPLNIVSGLTA